MFEFEQTEYGLKLTVRGALDSREVARLEIETERLVAGIDGEFSALVDCMDYIPAEREITAVLQRCEELALKAGIQRMAVVFKSPIVRGQVQQIAHLSGAVGISRYFDASKVDNAEQMALDWAALGVEPETNIDGAVDQDQSVRSQK